jgi:hypothetical protein
MSAVTVVEQEQAAVAREVALRGALAHIEREYGQGALMRMGDESAQVRCDAIPTGALSLLSPAANWQVAIATDPTRRLTRPWVSYPCLLLFVP